MRYIGTIGLIALLACDNSTNSVEKNVAPEITSLLINPDAGITTSTDLLCVATAEDENGDVLSLSYVWTDSQGAELSNLGELSLNSDIVSPNEELTCTVTASDGIVDVTSSVSVTVDNTAPEISSVSISPEEIDVDTLLECSFEASDADGEELTATYSWTQNGVEVGTDSTLQLNPTDYTSDDLIECTVTVEDGFGGTASETAQVYVDNTAPVIGSIAISPEMAYSTDTLTCTASDIFDAEGHEVTLSYEWLINGETQTETTDTLSGPFTVGAEVLCRVTPNDARMDGQTVEASVTILNTAPVMNDISITPNTGVEADTLLECVANSSDIDNEALTTMYEWTDNAGTVIGSTSTLQLDSTMVSPLDSVNCTATVEDIHGAVDSLTTSVTVDNTLPVVDSTAMISGTPGTGETLTCSAAFSDLNDGLLTATYEWTKSDGTVLSSTDTYTIDSNETDVGDELTCTATAMDADGEVITSSASVTVQNELPTISSVSLSPDPLISTDDVNCVANGVYDLDMDSVSLSYEWTVDGVVVSETSDVLSGPIAAGSTVECAVTPNDGFGNGTTVSASITVENTPPIVDSVELDSTEILSDGTVTATVSLSDIDATQTVSANYEWFVNGTSVQNGSTSTLDGSYFVKGDAVYVVVTPNDGVEDGTPVQSSSITIGNTAPSNLVVSITSSDSFYNDSTLTCSATADDLDVTENVDSLTFDYTWSNGSIGNTLFLDSSVALPGDTITCSVTATDGDDSVTAEDAQVITNRTPVVDSVSLPQNVTATTSSIMCSATASDADGEIPTLSYVWTVDGNTVSETSDTLTQTFTAGSVIECSVIPNDSMVTGLVVSASTTVANTAPVVDSVTLDSVEILSDGTVTATATLSDVDPSNTLTANYEWFVNGTSVQNGSTSTLDGAYFVKGDDVYVVVTPNDGVEDGTPVQSSSITIGNTAPSNLVVSITSSDSFYNDSTLTCSATADDFDVTENVDSLTFNYLWTDGTTGDTLVLNSSVLPGDMVTCSVTVNDGDDSITVDEDQVIANRTPVVDSVSLPQNVTATTPSIMCSATASDADGEIPALSYAWTVDGNSVAETSDTLTQTFNSGSVIECSVTPNDAMIFGVTVTASTTVANTAPVVDSVTLDSVEILSDGTVTATATLSDVDPSNTLTANYEWFVNGTSVQNGSTSTLDGSYFVKGDDVYVVVTPNDGVEDGTPVQSSSITIGNTAPSNLVVSVTSSDSFYNDSTLTCSATADDLDVTENVDSLTFDYTWSNGSIGNTLVLDSSVALPGDTITCSVVASDGTDTVSGSDSQGITNRTPIVDSVSLPQNVTAATSSITCSATGSDADGTTPTLSYAWTVNGNSVSETSNTLTQAFTVGSTITCSVTPSDSSVSGLALSASTTVGNTAPVVDSVTLNSPVKSDGTVTATATLSDIDSSQSITATYNWFVNGTSVQNGSSNTLAGSNFVKGDSVYVVVTPNDGVESGTAVQSSSVTIANTAPSNLVVSVTSSDSFYNDSTLTCSATADDLDVTENVDSLNFDYTWSTGAVGSTLTLSSGLASPGDTITCSVVASDGTDTVSGSDSQGIANRAPTATASLPSSATASTTSLTCTGAGSDPDGTTPTLSYGWSINGSPVSETSSTLPGPFAYNDAITCGVTASDGSLTGSATASVTIGNTAPVVNSVTIDSSAYTNDTLTATVSTSDIDSQTVSVNYNWFVNGSSVQNGSTATLSGATYFDRDDTVYVVVTPNDGVENGSTAQSSTLTISNTAPTAPTVAVTATSTPPVELIDDLTCSITSGSVDADGDSLSYTYNWYDPNGSNVQTTSGTTSLTDTFLASGTTAGLWECEVIASDGSLTATTTSDLEVDADWPGLLEFTNCGQTGRYGPSQSQCDSAYNGTTLDSSVTLASGVQQWTVPTSGFYRIVAAGAQGGTGNVSNYPGGDGAIMRGTFYLTAGDTLNIVVGQRGTNGVSSSPAGGGGGTFVYTGSIGGTGLYIAAGGGGGGGEESTANGYDATSALQGYNYFGSSGTIGYGGTSGSKVTGGAGWYSAGTGTAGGQQWIGGDFSGGYGGFGGGAGGESSDGGGGGGGYSGAPGHSNTTRSTWGGGGAGSYNSGTAQSNTSGANASHGYVTIDEDYAESCNAILTADPTSASGVYEIAPNGTAFEVYCDMTTDGGGWTMCYTENSSMVHLQTETTSTGTYGTAGYRADCRNVPFTDVLYVNHDNAQTASFYSQSGSSMTIAGLGYSASGSTAGTLFTPGGVASTSYDYQLMVCDQNWMWTGLMMSGYTGCYKACNSWCGDTSSPYFRTDGDDGGSYNGVAFNENGHTNVSYKTMSVGIR